MHHSHETRRVLGFSGGTADFLESLVRLYNRQVGIGVAVGVVVGVGLVLGLGLVLVGLALGLVLAFQH